MLKLFSYLNCNFNSFFIFIKKKGLNSKVDYMAYILNLVLSSWPGQEALLN
jgi:hypothetical protein